MPLIDAALTITAGVTISASASPVGSAINFGYSDVGTGKELHLIVIATADGSGATSSNSYYYELRTADTVAGLAAGTVVARSDVIPGTSHVSGQIVWNVPIPPRLMKARCALYAVKAGLATVSIAAYIGSPPENGMGVRSSITAAS